MERKQCRCCCRHFSGRKDLVSLFDYDQTFPSQKIKFSEMLLQISGENEISRTDQLPKKVCAICLSSIRTSYYFKLEVKRSLEKFRSEIVNIKQEPSETHIAIIRSPRHLAEDQFTDMLDEITSDNHFDDDQEIIDYEPTETTTVDEDEQEEEEHSEIFENDKVNGQSYNCNICTKQFHNLKALTSHTRYHQAHNCRHCEKKFLNSTQLKLHVRARHPENFNQFRLGYREAVVNLKSLDICDFHECSTCTQRFATKDALYRHHAECDNKCIECGLRIPRTDLYFKHLEAIHNIRLAPLKTSSTECPFCFLNFNERKLPDHIQQCHPEENSVVDSISEVGESTSNDGFIFQCQVCPSRFHSLKGLNQHKSLKHSNREGDVGVITKNVKRYTRDEFLEKFMVKKSKDFYRCIPCKKEIGFRSVVLHMRSKHAAVRSFRCELCPEAFFRTDYRQRHVFSNHPNSFKCTLCNIQFDRAHKIDSHNSSYHNMPIRNTKPEENRDIYDLTPGSIFYIENTKGYDYTDDLLLVHPNPSNIQQPSTSSSSANTSVSIVINEKPLTKDEFCDRNISHVSDKIVHCNDCEQDIQKNSLISHLLWKHSVDKPLKCPFCNQRVVKNNARLMHMDKCHPHQYLCTDCETQFAKHQNLVDHCEEVHSKKCNVPKSSGEVEDLQLNEMRFIANKENDAIEDEIMNQEIVNINPVILEERKFNCQYCRKTFTSSKNLLIHKSHKHKNETIPDQSMSFEEFLCNWIEDINETNVKCLICEQNLKRKNLINHLKARHSTTGAYLCEICNEHFFRIEDRLQHFSSQHRGIFYCESCNIQHVCNSRYARHMKEVHGIEIDHGYRVEVDLNVTDLRFVASKRAHKDDEKRLSHLKENLNDEEEDENNLDPMEEMMEQMNNTQEMTRSDFMNMYFQNVARDTKHCTACNKTFQASSLYHHLVHIHATVFPYKCPFCELRLERNSTRARHMQIFHPDEYKCNMCGIQFQKHIKYTEHMLSEHGLMVTTEKSPLEEEDISSADMRYAANRIEETTLWPEEEENNSVNSSMVSFYYPGFVVDTPKESNSIAMPSIKTEDDNSEALKLLREVVVQQFTDESEAYPYQEFKDKYLRNIDSLTTECVPCKRTIIKTSVCAHLRLWHASKMMFNCELCPIGFRRHDYRQRHMASAHPLDFVCARCNRQFYRSALYVDHMKNAHKVSLSVAELKPKDEVDVPLEKMTFSAHVPESERVHPEEGVRIKRRLSIACDERPINPNAGGMTFKDFRYQHVREEGELLRCVPCDESISKLSLKKHLKKYHATSRPYNCELCDDSFFRLEERRSHMRGRHPNSLKCSHCNIQFYMSSIYIEHMRSHGQLVKAVSNKGKTDVDVPIERLRFVPTKQNSSCSPIVKKQKYDEYSHIPDDAEMTREQFTKKFLRTVRPKMGDPQSKCIACSKMFSAKNRYFHVLHNHVTKRPFGCEFCDLRFFTTFKRNKHMTIKHADKGIKCEECNIQFDRTLAYGAHMKEEHQITINSITSHDENLDVPSDKLRYTKKSTSVRVLAREQQKDFLENDNSNIDFPSTSTSRMIPENLTCSSCNRVFDSSRSYRQHMRDHGTNSDCVFHFELNLPTKLEEKEKPKECLFHCDLCEKKFSTKFAINAHKKFKHGFNLDGSAVNSKRKIDKQQKFDVECEICSFTSFRRDYVEHHVKQAHKGEFQCTLCARQLSNYNYYLHHMYGHSFESKEEEENCKTIPFKCDLCEKRFINERFRNEHQSTKHTESHLSSRRFFCNYCNVNYYSKTNYEIHLEGYKHKNLQTYIESIEPYSTYVKEEEKMTSTIHTENLSPPAAKKPRLEESSSEDKLDYLKYLEQLPNGNYKCGICGKTKLSRKFLLHHLKQHEEVPTFNCEKCPERFVFKRKYDKHIKMHEDGLDEENTVSHDNDEKESIVNEHPKFQEAIKSTLSEGIRCHICNVAFKLTIMLNKHNNTWHSDENPNKDASMHDQKQKIKERGTIKIHRCNFCSDTYHKEEKLAEHLKTCHPDHCDVIDENSSKFICNKCNLTFEELQFLENHRKLFCIHRSILNEQ